LAGDFVFLSEFCGSIGSLIDVLRFDEDVLEKGFACFPDSHRWFVDASFAIIGKQGFDPYARLPAARAVSGTFQCSAGPIVNLLLPFGDLTETVAKT
jgi:hypothetical protein